MTAHPRPLRLFRPLASVGLVAAVATLVACGGSGQGDTQTPATDSAATTAAAGQTAPATTDSTGGMAGMDHANMPGMAGDMAGMHRSAPRDSNQVFLRMMSDHHEGLVAMSDSALPRLQGAKGDAQELRRKQEDEQQRMLGMLTRQYGDSVTPMIMASNRAMIDSVTRAPQGTEADRTYYRQVIAHHREGIHHTDMHLPHLTGEVKQMAEKMKAEQQREIREFERKAAGGSAR